MNVAKRQLFSLSYFEDTCSSGHIPYQVRNELAYFSLLQKLISGSIPAVLATSMTLSLGMKISPMDVASSHDPSQCTLVEKRRSYFVETDIHLAFFKSGANWLVLQPASGLIVIKISGI